MGDRKGGRRSPWPVIAFAAVALALGGAASAQPMPVRAKLSIDSANPSTTRYVGVRLPGNQTTNYNYGSFNFFLGVFLKLEVWFADGSGPVDVTDSPNTVYTSAPNKPFGFEGNIFKLEDPGQSFVLTGRFTQAGKTVTSSFTIKEELFKAPGSSNGGHAQKQLYAGLDELSDAISTWARRAGVSAANQMPIWQSVDQLRLYLRLWWAGKSANAVSNVGDALLQAGAPADLLIRLSHFAVNMQNAGLIRIVQGSAGLVSILSGSPPYPAWLPPPDLYAFSSPPIFVYWFGLG